MEDTHAVRDVTSSALAVPYAFHDPEFVTWWLTSLYLFKPADQIAIAEMLSEAVHAPEVQREIEAFIDFRSAVLPAELGQPVAAESAEPAGAAVVARFRELWRDNPWMVSAGALAILFFSLKAVWFLGHELVRIVF
jgi:hypothetical protein